MLVGCAVNPVYTAFQSLYFPYSVIILNSRHPEKGIHLVLELWGRRKWLLKSMHCKSCPPGASIFLSSLFFCFPLKIIIKFFYYITVGQGIKRKYLKFKRCPTFKPLLPRRNTLATFKPFNSFLPLSHESYIQHHAVNP